MTADPRGTGATPASAAEAPQRSGFAWRYVPPNLVTAAGLTMGLMSVYAVLEGRLVDAAWLIVWCTLIDKLDGAVARLLHASSEFGVQMDSFSDLVTFGVCPAVLVMGVLLGSLEQPPTTLQLLLVLPGCALYSVAAALRLARFNLLTGDYGKGYFFGLPTTLCGGLVAIYYLNVAAHAEHPLWLQALPGILALFGVLMVSNLPLPKFTRRRKLWLEIFQDVNLAGVYACGFARLFPEYLAVMVALYTTVGVGWGLLHGIKPPRPGAHADG